ncbi:MAG: DsbA family protein [Halalkalicoccus sp.]|nr:DsbA family protein [Halalkalicoccus sp.]
MKRRAFLGTAAGLALAGCLGSDDPDRDAHPAAQRLDGSPWFGAPPDETDRLIVAFEDPSCSTCRRFHESTFRDLRVNLLESGSAGFVYRPYPIVLAWGQPASQAVIATADRDPSAAWTLLDHYYAAQDVFNGVNVLGTTRDHLDAETDVDGTAVVEDVRANAYDDGIGSALADGDAAGATTTPTFFLFREERFITKLTGVQDASVFASSLEV